MSGISIKVLIVRCLYHRPCGVKWHKKKQVVYKLFYYFIANPYTSLCKLNIYML